MRTCISKNNGTAMRNIARLGLLLAAAITVSASLSVRADAQTDRSTLLDEASRAYARNDFNKSRDILEQLCMSYPKDPVIHYLLGNSYLVASRLELAEREYQLCLKLNPAPAVSAHCLQALAKIRVYASNRSSAATAAGVVNSNSSRATVSANSAPVDPNLMLNEQKLTEQQQELIERADLEQSQMTAHHRRVSDAQSNRIREQAEFEISQLQKYSYNSRGRQVSNPGYEAEVRAIREDADRRIKASLDALERNSSTIARNAERTRNDVSKMVSNLREAAQSDKGSMRLMPNGSNLYTKNYVNFGEDTQPEPPRPIEPLRATRDRATVKPIGSPQH